MSEVVKRILFGVPAAVFFVAVLWLGGWIFGLVTVIIIALAQYELMRMLKIIGTPSDVVYSYLFAAWIIFYSFLPLPNVVGLTIFLVFVTQRMIDTKPDSVFKLFSTFFSGLYIPIGFTCLLALRNSGTNEHGIALALALVLMIWGGDAFAYFGGRKFGKTKLAPAISPNKTIEGFMFGIIGCFVGLVVAIYAIPFESPLNLLNGLPLVFLIGIFGPVGDLLESQIKRKAGVKDSSTILPGHGGFFDRFDALISASVAMYIYIEILKFFDYVVL